MRQRPAPWRTRFSSNESSDLNVFVAIYARPAGEGCECLFQVQVSFRPLMGAVLKIQHGRRGGHDDLVVASQKTRS